MVTFLCTVIVLLLWAPLTAIGVAAGIRLSKEVDEC